MSGTPLLEHQLVENAKNGDDASLSVLFETYRPRLYARALAILGYGPAAEDAVQDTFISALTKLQTLQRSEAFGAWLFKIVTNYCYMQARGQKRELALEALTEDYRLAADVLTFDERLDDVAARGRVWSALEKLPEMLRVVVILRYFGRYQGYEEIAHTLSIPVGTVRSRLSAARQQLVTALNETDYAPFKPFDVLTRERKAYYIDCWNGLYEGRVKQFFSHYTPDLVLAFSNARLRKGRIHWEQELIEDACAGSKFVPEDALASASFTILDGRFENPKSDPLRCPPRVAAVLFHKSARTFQVNAYFSSHAAE
jgi:RNA polymerase sigma factor (sigma-70 family)